MPPKPRPEDSALTPLEQLDRITKPKSWLQRWRDRRNQLSATRHIDIAAYRNDNPPLDSLDSVPGLRGPWRDDVKIPAITAGPPRKEKP